MCGCSLKKCDPLMCECSCHYMAELLLLKNRSQFSEKPVKTSMHGSDVIVLAPEQYTFSESNATDI